MHTDTEATGRPADRAPRPRAVLASLALLTGLLASPTPAAAASARCPADKVEPGPVATAVEIARIERLWKDLHGPGASGGDGPLGCPIGSPVVPEGTSHAWTGIGQQFQRGWILLGRGAFDGGDVAVVRGLDTWTLWFTGLASIVLPTVGGVGSMEVRTASWVHGGKVFAIPVAVGPTSGVVSLLQCPTHQSYSSQSLSANGCTRLLPDLFTIDRPFDPAGRLTERLLVVPDALGKRQRVDAVLADWLPCHTRVPPRPTDVGEAALAHVLVMMRSDAPCPLSGESPRRAAIQWLSTMALPADMLPGTSFDASFPCPGRNGELDVTLAQLLRVMLDFRDVLGAPALDHLKGVVNLWGAAPRRLPYVTPNGSCAGFLILESENHILLQEATSYMINGIAGRDATANRDWLLKFLSQVARRDFYEFNSLPYARYQMKALFLLHDHAPDAQLGTVARGLLHWMLAKQAVSGNLDRDHRPYRRLHTPGPLVPRDWWGPAATPVTTAAAILAGPISHGHSDIDLQFEKGLDDAGKRALTDVLAYPRLGTLPAYSAEALVDAASTRYVLPETLVGWLERRFTDEDTNRLTYLQAFNHVPKTKEDVALFAQAGSGAELMSGNRNWTMIAGGTPAPPGDPGPPPSDSVYDIVYVAGGAVAGALAGAYLGTAIAGPIGTAAGAVIGAVVGAIFGAKSPADIALTTQHDSLWGTQAGTIRETTLIPTSGALDRSQTIRFGRPVVTTEGAAQLSRLCVADGFMCGFDLKMPTRPFAAHDGLSCPLDVTLPPALSAAFQARVGPGSTLTSVLGCLTKRGGYQADGNWDIWTFENGMLAIGHDDAAGSERFAGAWIEGRDVSKRGAVRVAWDIRGDGYDWFRVHAYDRQVGATGGEPPGGWIVPLPVVGNAGDRIRETPGDTSIAIPNDLDPEFAAPLWDVLIVGCTKEYFLGVLTGHDCVDNKMPRLSVDVAPLPRQAFSCAVHKPPQALSFQPLPHEGIVMEVGSCKGGPYGLFVYVWSQACPGVNFSVSQSAGFQCREGASDYGFVVAAPSRGMEPEEFRNIVEASMATSRAAGQDYRPDAAASIDVPLAPPVVRGPSGAWMPTAPPSKHTVSFRWPVVDGTAILGDSAALGLYAAGALGAAPVTWPTALGHVVAPDSTGPPATPISSVGDGCLTIAGFPTPRDRDPLGLLIDLRNSATPIVEEHRNSSLASRCAPK